MPDSLLGLCWYNFTVNCEKRDKITCAVVLVFVEQAVCHYHEKNYFLFSMPTLFYTKQHLLISYDSCLCIVQCSIICSNNVCYVRRTPDYQIHWQQIKLKQDTSSYPTYSEFLFQLHGRQQFKIQYTIIKSHLYGIGGYNEIQKGYILYRQAVQCLGLNPLSHREHK